VKTQCLNRARIQPSGIGKRRGNMLVWCVMQNKT